MSNFETKKQMFHRTANYLEDSLREGNALTLMGAVTTLVGVYESNLYVVFGGAGTATFGVKKLLWDAEIYRPLLARKYKEVKNFGKRLKEKLRGTRRLSGIERELSFMRKRYEAI
ncbi:hypothetical protein HYX15_02985 [Candidatus Woesearchaeota archaeon]|nr:hypothetical protein [Candidatus Woesearchaeota archaeon]